MTTLIHFLTEQQTTEQQWAYQIANDCKPAIDRASGPQAYSLYRGIETRKDFLHKQVRTERQPRDTDQKIHRAMDEWFYENFGTRYRSNSIACTGDRVSTADYGNSYLVFPIGQFDFIWSPQLHDVGAEVEGKVVKLIGPFATKHQAWENVDFQSVKQAVQQVMEDVIFWESKLPQAIADGNEIMVHTKEYYAVAADLQYGFRQKLMQAYKELYG